MSKPVFCAACVNYRVPWFGDPRCAVNRLSYVHFDDPRELYPCKAINTTGNCPDYDDGLTKQGRLKFKASAT